MEKLACVLIQAATSLPPLDMNACLPGCVWNATPRSLSPLERNIGFWTQAWMRSIGPAVSHSQIPVLFLLTVKSFSIFGCKEYNQSDFGVDHLMMSMCRVLSCVTGRGCFLRPVCSLIKTLLAFALQKLLPFILYSKAKFAHCSRYLL